MTTDFCLVSYQSTRDVGRVLLQLSMTFPNPHTVTVVDNSDDNRGFSVAANLAAKQGRGDIIAFLNPDLCLCDKWADETIRALKADPKLVIAKLNREYYTSKHPDHGKHATLQMHREGGRV